jgi:hypothetical protein
MPQEARELILAKLINDFMARGGEQSGPALRASRAVVTVRATSWKELSSQEQA